MARQDGQAAGRAALQIGRVDVRAAFQEQFDEVAPARLGGEVQGRAALRIPRMYVGLTGRQLLDEGPACGSRARSTAVWGCRPQ